MTRASTDRDSGSADIGLGFLAELESWIATDTSGSAPALRSALLRRLRQAQADQPSMALVHQLAARALQVADGGAAREQKVPELRTELARSCEAERADLIAAGEAVARTAVELLDRREPWIATLSNSGTVRDALCRVRDSGREPRALCAEGRPRLEGRRLATALAAAGLPVWLVAERPPRCARRRARCWPAPVAEQRTVPRPLRDVRAARRPAPDAAARGLHPSTRQDARRGA